MKFKWTIYRKIQILIFVVLFVVYGIFEGVLVQLIKGNVRDEFNSNVMNTSILLQKNTEVMFKDARKSIDFLINQYENKFRDDKYVENYLLVLTETNDFLSNAFIAYNDGTYVLVPKVELPQGFDPRERTWYKAAYESREINWSQPYVDIATEKLVITGSAYIELADTDGVLGVDIQLDGLPLIINKTRLGEEGFVLLVNEEGYIIADSKNKYVKGQIEDIKDQEFLDSNIITGSFETSKGLYFLRRLNQTNIRLVAFLPHDDLVSTSKKLQLITSLALVFSLFVGVLISYFLSKRITGPIERLTKTMLESELTDKLILFEEKSNDETSTLIEGYNSMAIHVNKQNAELKAVSVELIESEQKLQDQYEKVIELAYTDYLTGLPNRIRFEMELKNMIKKDLRFALFYIDLDNFKNINDTYGHNHGDFVLKIISNRFRECCAGKHYGARLSGDEFGVIVIYNDSVELLSIADEMLRILNEKITYDDLEFSITGSMGISKYPDDGIIFEEILTNADIAMYEAKKNSKNQYKIFNQELKNELLERVTLEAKLLLSIEKDEIFLCYQPLIDFKTKEIRGFESLARWQEETLGLIYPDIFIPLAEHNLFINKLGHYVLEESIKFGNVLFKETGKYYEMNVNVSLFQLHIECFVEDVIELLEKYNYPPEYLNLEITESVALEKDDKIHQKLVKLRNYGIPISLDDFGTGYSSLNHLLNIPLTHMKIDRLIIVEATKKDEVYHLVQGLVDFAHAINLEVVAEGIEDKHMESVMEKLNFDYAQGYLYSRPITDTATLKYIDEINKKNISK